MMICKEIDEYIAYVRSGEYRVCEEQLLLCEMVEKVFREEDVYVDEEQLRRYLGLQKYHGKSSVLHCITVHTDQMGN